MESKNDDKAAIFDNLCNSDSFTTCVINRLHILPTQAHISPDGNDKEVKLNDSTTSSAEH